MTLIAEYRDARAHEDLARLRRLVALRAMIATGSSQREIAAHLGISQPAVSQQLKTWRDLVNVHPETLIKAAAPVLVDVARTHGFDRLAVFGSVARGQARPDSDVDLLVDAPPAPQSRNCWLFATPSRTSSAAVSTSSPTAASRPASTTTFDERQYRCDGPQGGQGDPPHPRLARPRRRDRCPWPLRLPQRRAASGGRRLPDDEAWRGRWTPRQGRRRPATRNRLDRRHREPQAGSSTSTTRSTARSPGRPSPATWPPGNPHSPDRSRKRNTLSIRPDDDRQWRPVTPDVDPVALGNELDDQLPAARGVRPGCSARTSGWCSWSLTVGVLVRTVVLKDARVPWRILTRAGNIRTNHIDGSFHDPRAAAQKRSVMTHRRRQEAPSTAGLQAPDHGHEGLLAASRSPRVRSAGEVRP